MIASHSSEAELIASSHQELEFGILLENIASGCLSDIGREFVLELQPYTDATELRRELDLVEEVRQILLRAEQLPLDGLRDIRRYINRSIVQNAFLSPSELLYVRDALRSARLLKAHLKNLSEHYPALNVQFSEVHENRFLEKHISDAIDESASVKDTASRELQRIRQDLQETNAKLKNRLNKLIKKFSEDDIAMDEYATQREGRWVLPVKTNFKREVPGIIHGVSQTGSTVFLEPAEIFEMNNQLSLLSNEERREIEKILTTLTSEIAAEAGAYLRTAYILGAFDAQYAKASHAIAHGGFKPIICDEERIVLNKVHHPLLFREKAPKPIPLSVSFDSETRGHLVSGPNAGGKTVALKCMGISVLMATCGIFPLGECETNLRRIFSAIGDHQSIENNLSTFSSQLIRLRDIMSHCGPDALVMIDEICSGTDPYEGSALACGILDSLLERRAFFVVTTHQSSLKSYALTKPSIRNASMEFDDERLRPTFRFMSGVPGNSYAFVLAENLGFPDNVLGKAKTYLGEKHSELEESISALQKIRREAETNAMKTAEIKQKAEQMRADYEVRNTELRQKKAKLIEDARNEAQEILTRANSLVENTIRQIREQQKDVSEVRKGFDKERSELQKKIAKSEAAVKVENKDSAAIQHGDFVTMENSANPGLVLSVDSAAKSAMVEFNGLKFKAPLASLRKAPKSLVRQQEKASSGGSYVRFDARASVDVRGQRGEEAVKEIEQLISNAVLTNLESVTVIHGKGTGALRHAIHEHLRNHPSVREYRNGTLVEGGDGVTVITIS